jgi:hypothetical protein
MKKKTFAIFIVFFFIASLTFLHQKILIYVEAYKISKNHRLSNELVDKRDYLVYNLTKETSVQKINQWAEKNNFPPTEKVLALNLRRAEPLKPANKVLSMFTDLLGITTGSSTALAGENNSQNFFLVCKIK